jgi:ABC-2 type transport system ATP-binding protein
MTSYSLAPMGQRYAAVAIDGVSKTFHVPKQHVMTLKERALHPLRRIEVDQLHALRDVSVHIAEGEFFGIVGRNGSGKSTLLKCLAGIYRADTGQIMIAGRLTPFIELGVGFNMELTALDNVVINGVMMGLTPSEARARFDEVIAFAELEDFLDLKLKNYSSGMQVRLAFSLMVQSDADVLLIDEVLAVGDAAFQQKCFNEFRRLRDEGRTIVLVTHDMVTIERFCHRAMLLEYGRMTALGDPADVGARYMELNFQHQRGAAGQEAPR